MTRLTSHGAGSAYGLATLANPDQGVVLVYDCATVAEVVLYADELGLAAPLASSRTFF
ncbi:MAG: hypothetical protein JRF46_01245 [Deltaproteobacteria bacterium]|nr:hypothetical protein [Deltaproteobacteria bacterium]